MIHELVVVDAVVLAVVLMRMAQRYDESERGYMLIVMALFGAALVAAGTSSMFWGVVVLSLSVLLVVVPAVLETWARNAFSRSKLRRAVGLASLRAIFMPGAGLSRQQAILEGLAVLERDGVDAAVRYFRDLAEDADEAELVVLHEQIVSMLLYGQRWEEAVALFDGQLYTDVSEIRPTLGLGMIRAYGETGRIDRAAALLRVLEEGPLGSDPRSLSVLSQARLTFLAFAGEPDSVCAATEPQPRALLGLSEAAGLFYRSVGWSRAGRVEEARGGFADLQEVAGRGDERIVAASEAWMARLAEVPEAAPLREDPELRGYVEVVAQRLRLFVRAAPALRKPGRLIATPVLITVLLAHYVVYLALGGGGLDLLQLGGLTPATWYEGQWWRLLASTWLVADPFAVLLVVYSLWMGGPVLERVQGPWRLVGLSLGAAVAGTTMDLVTDASPLTPHLLGGGTWIAIAVLSSAIVMLSPRLSPAVPASNRRALLVPLIGLWFANALLVVLGINVVDTSIAGLAVAVGCGATNARLSSTRRWWWLGWVGVVLAAMSVAATLWAVLSSPRDALASSPSRSVALTEDGPESQLPWVFRSVQAADHWIDNDVPLVPGAIDFLALRSGSVVQITQRSTSDVGSTKTVLFDHHPELERAMDEVRTSVPPSLAAAMHELGQDEDRLTTTILRQGGENVVVVVEDRVTGRSLVASPPKALDEAAGLYAEALLGAEEPSLERDRVDR